MDLWRRDLDQAEVAKDPASVNIPEKDAVDMQSIDDLASAITELNPSEQQALLDKVAQLNFQKGLHELAERFRTRLDREKQLNLPSEQVWIELHRIAKRSLTMTTPRERWLLDTNVWIFGLRRESGLPACAQLLERIGTFSVVIPLQVLKELNLVLSETEMRDFYQTINQSPEFIELSWEPVPDERVRFYERLGCRKGDAVIAAHAEESGVGIIVSENRQFLQTLKDFPVSIITAKEALVQVDDTLP